MLRKALPSARVLNRSEHGWVYDPARDFQAGEARADAGEQSGSEARQEVAAALESSKAKGLAQANLARAWAQRDKLTLRLPPKRLTLEPGASVALPLSPPLWTVAQLTIDGFVVVAELHPATTGVGALTADSGRIAPTPDLVVAPLTLALLDVPNVLGSSTTNPTVFLAASSATGSWKSQPVEIAFGGQSIGTQTTRAKSMLGEATTVLAAGSTDLVDNLSSVDVALVDESQWLTSCDRDGLAAGQNLASIGHEVIQFADAMPLGGGRFRLTQLLRGRGGTEWACSVHTAGEPFCLIVPGTIQSVEMPSWSIGATVETTSAGGATASGLFAGMSVRPLSPVNLSAELLANGSLALSWTRRSRQGLAWLDGIDAPLGETTEQYRVVLTNAAASVEFSSDQPSLAVTSDALVPLGSGPVSIEVRQIGDFAASCPAQASINLI